jgi:hypothetical protein
MSICGDGLEQWEAGVGGESTRSSVRNRKILLFFFLLNARILFAVFSSVHRGKNVIF